MLGSLLNFMAVAAAAVLPFFVRTQTAQRPSAFFSFVVGGGLCLLGSWYAAQPLIGCVVTYSLRLALLTAIAVFLGRTIGHLLRLQWRLNQFFESASKQLAFSNRLSPYLVVVSWTLMAVNPLATVGPFLEALTGRIDIMVAKSAIDFVAVYHGKKEFRLAALASALPILGWLLVWFEVGRLVHSTIGASGGSQLIQMVCGVLIASVGVRFAGLRQIQLADYMPSLLAALFLGWRCF